MSDITIGYKGNTIGTMDATGTKTLLTSGKYCEDDIEIAYVKPSGGGPYIGGTVAWNQLAKEMNSTNFVYDIASTTVSISNGIAEVLPSVRYGGVQASSSNRFTIIDGHKYFGIASVMSQNGLSVFITVNSVVGAPVNASNNWSEIYVIANGNTAKNNNIRIRTNNTSDFTTFYVKKVMVCDLTAMFGSTIADYVYTLESGTAGAGIAWLKANGFFNSAYYPYDAGALKSVETFAHPFKDSNGKIIGYFPQNFDLELRGIPKLDANNVLYYDGDEYDGNGTVTRKCGIRAYTSGDATDGSTMITDGTNTVYKLTTPTTESV